MDVNAILGAMGSTPGPKRAASSELDKDAFVELMVENLRHQDPTKPAESDQWFAQVSQMTMVEQITNLAQNSTKQLADAQTGRALALVGRPVTYIGAEGVRTTGTVEKVDLSGAAPTLTIAGTAGIDLAKVVEASA